MTTRYKSRRAAVCTLLLSGATWCAALRAEDSTVSIAATAGTAFGRRSVEFALFEARATLRPHLSVASAIGYVRAEHGFSEWQLRASATANLTVGRWIVDDRNMLYVSSEAVKRYRNRLRATLPAFLGRPRLSAHAFDEIYFDFDRGGIIRNNVAIGLSTAVRDCCRVELSHIWTDNRGTRETRYLLALATVTIGR
jgi:hypothetical protein